jgi:hypothetical protein
MKTGKHNPNFARDFEIQKAELNLLYDLQRKYPKFV